MNLRNEEALVIVIGGKARTGKSTLGSFLKEEFESLNKKTVITNFSKTIKQYAKDYFGWDGKEESKPRELLQFIGTNLIRQKMNKPYFHINRTCEDIEVLSNFFDVIIIDDARVEEEITEIKSKFKKVISIKMNRNAEVDMSIAQKNHYTEIGLDNFFDFDYIIDNNYSLDDLRLKAKEIAKNSMI